MKCLVPLDVNSTPKGQSSADLQQPGQLIPLLASVELSWPILVATVSTASATEWPHCSRLLSWNIFQRNVRFHVADDSLQAEGVGHLPTAESMLKRLKAFNK